MFIRSKVITTAVVTVILSLAVSSGAQQDFSFSTPDGSATTLSSVRGNVAVLLFSGSQDPQRREGVKALESLAERFQGKEVKVFWVCINPVADLTNDQLKTMAGVSGSVRFLRDTNQSAFKRFSGKVAQLPTIVVLDRQGNPFGQPRGGFNPNSDFINDLASIIDRLLQSK